jgi:hypothetical protein
MGGGKELAAPQKSPAQERSAGQIGALGGGDKKKRAKQTNWSRAGLFRFPSLKGLRIFDGAPNLFLAALTLRQASGSRR